MALDKVVEFSATEPSYMQNSMFRQETNKKLT